MSLYVCLLGSVYVREINFTSLTEVWKWPERIFNVAGDASHHVLKNCSNCIGVSRTSLAEWSIVEAWFWRTKTVPFPSRLKEIFLITVSHLPHNRSKDLLIYSHFHKSSTVVISVRLKMKANNLRSINLMAPEVGRVFLYLSKIIDNPYQMFQYFNTIRGFLCSLFVQMGPLADPFTHY